jgi:hypothetical protein
MSQRSAPTAFRFDPTVKSALALISEREGRSMANMMEWLIRKHCEREGLGWPIPGAAGALAARSAPRKKSARRTTNPK